MLGWKQKKFPIGSLILKRGCFSIEYHVFPLTDYIIYSGTP